MSITLNGTALSSSLQWVNRYNWSPVAQASKRTLGGTLVVYPQDLTAGRPIQLVANAETGWFTKDMVDAMLSLAAQSSGQFVLDFHGETHTVMFAHEGGSAISFEPLIKKATPLSTDYFTGTINLFTI